MLENVTTAFSCLAENFLFFLLLMNLFKLFFIALWLASDACSDKRPRGFSFRELKSIRWKNKMCPFHPKDSVTFPYCSINILSTISFFSKKIWSFLHNVHEASYQSNLQSIVQNFPMILAYNELAILRICIWNCFIFAHLYAQA